MQARLSQHQNSESLRLLARRNLKTNIAHELLLLQALWWTNVIALELAFLHPISEEVESTVLPEYVLNYLTLLLPNVAYMTLNGVNFPNPRFFATKCKTWVAEIVWKARWLAVFQFARGNVMGRNRMREITLEKCVLEFGCYYFLTDLAFYDCHESLERLSISSDTMWRVRRLQRRKTCQTCLHTGNARQNFSRSPQPLLV